MSEWLIQEGSLDPEVAFVGESRYRSRSSGKRAEQSADTTPIGVFLKPLIVHNTRKWFGDAAIRLDAIVAQSGGTRADLYSPLTFRFPRVADGDNLAQGDNGLMVYYGRPKEFLTLAVMLSRDTEDSDDLAALITKNAHRPEVSSALEGMAAALVSPHVAAAKLALTSALTLGELAYGILRQVTPKCLGLYRMNFMSERDDFGVGRHPKEGAEKVKDFEFACDIVRNK